MLETIERAEEAMAEAKVIKRAFALLANKFACEAMETAIRLNVEVSAFQRSAAERNKRTSGAELKNDFLVNMESAFHIPDPEDVYDDIINHE